MKALALLSFIASSAFAAGVPAPAEPGVNVPWVKVDTVGYAPAWKKIAIVNLPVSWSLELKDEAGRAVWRSQRTDLKDLGVDASSKDRCWQVDFSGLTLTGRFHFELLAEGHPAKWLTSAPFDIKAQPYAQALAASQKMFYYQRTRTALKEPYTLWGADDDDYTRATASHADDNVGWLLDTYPTKEKRLSLQKGWHDAGNFDMYIPSTAPTVETLLWAYELRPKAFVEVLVAVGTTVQAGRRSRSPS